MRELRAAPGERRPLLYLQGMGGLGDNVYQRPLVLNQLDLYDEVYLQTPYPELYRDAPIKCVDWPNLALRCQNESRERWTGEWHAPPHQRPRQARYLLSDPSKNVVTDLERSYHRDGRYKMSLPSFAECWPLTRAAELPVAVIRSPTVRREWLAPARNPKPEYVHQAAEILMAEGFHVVSVAHVAPGVEWFEAEPAPAHVSYHHGELDTATLMALIQSASVTVGGLGFILPASLAYGTPHVSILGGLGRYSRPGIVTDPRMNLSRLRFVIPDDLCPCAGMRHACDKTITDFGGRFRQALNEVIHEALLSGRRS